MYVFRLKLFLFSALFLLFLSCKKTHESPAGYKTEHIIVLVIDGARYSETWGDPDHRNIPVTAGVLAREGVINTQFYNNGPTYTLAGHTSITTGFYQEIDNSGAVLPDHPSFFQYWNSVAATTRDQSWIITSKDKLEVLANCQENAFKYCFMPSWNCGLNGLGSGYREDSLTMEVVFETLTKKQPQLMLINLRDPDYSAHTTNWKYYLQGIRKTDRYAGELLQFIRNNAHYKDNTTLFITNDHGRHLDSIPGGFSSHGDQCEGCRHIFLYAYGPDFRKGVITNVKRELPDITATISELLHIRMDHGQGKVMLELFNQMPGWF